MVEEERGGKRRKKGKVKREWGGKKGMKMRGREGKERREKEKRGRLGRKEREEQGGICNN